MISRYQNGLRTPVIWLVPLAVLACNDNKLDQDGDGFTELTGDCDDLDANVHPEAQEVCYNGIDDNCNGVEDEEGATSGRVWYQDYDGDGYGKEDLTVLACDQPEGYAAEKWDCQEDNAAIHPGAVEVCDYVDNDCDGEIDEATSEDAVVWYPDRDGDGYGDADASVHSCEAIPGFVNEAGDCNDSDPGMSPDRTEVCTTPLDEDCDGETNDPDAYGCTDFYADLDGDGYSGSVACLCEAEAPYTETEATDCDDTRADVYPGAPSTERFRPQDCDGEAVVDITVPDVHIVVESMDANWLAHRVALSDLDGDGVEGLLALSVLDRAAWLDGPLDRRTSFDEARIWFPDPDSGNFGYMVAVVDDLDGDGIRDFAWGWSGDESHAAGVYFFSGAATGELSVDDAIGVVPMAVSTTGTYKWRPMATGDFTGDGATEVYLRDNELGPVLVRPALGSGGSLIPLSVPDVSGTIGLVAKRIDVNNDGQDDLVLNGHGAKLEPGYMYPRTGISVSGAVLVYEGPLTEGSHPSFWVYGTSGNVGNIPGDFIWHDVDHDGHSDLLVSQYWLSFVGYQAGLFWAVYGPFEHTMVEEDWPSIVDGEPWLSGVEDEDLLAYATVLDDLTGDGEPDLLVRGDKFASYLIDTLGTGHGRADERGRRIEGGQIWSAATVADLNGDGAAEVALSLFDSAGWTVGIYYGDAP